MTRILVLMLVSLLALSACGRRGALEPPPGTAGNPGADQNMRDQQYEPVN